MSEPVIISNGAKGGVGKSIVAMAAVHVLLSQGRDVLLIEADTANPDVGKAYGKTVETLYLNLDEREGWMDLVNALAEHPAKAAVINTPARSGEGTKRYAGLLAEALTELDRELITLWVINSQRDSVQLLKEFLDSVSMGQTFVLRNLYHGPERKFELYNGSRVREAIEKQGKTLNFPDVADRISDQLYGDRLTIQKIMEQAPLGNRAEVKRWIGACETLFAEVLQ